MTPDTCQVRSVNQERVARTRARMRDEETIVALAETFKVLSEPSRVRILLALADEELCVCDIAAALDMTSSAVSHQLRILRTARLVRARKEGKMVYYSLDDEHVRGLFAEGIRHVEDG